MKRFINLHGFTTLLHTRDPACWACSRGFFHNASQVECTHRVSDIHLVRWSQRYIKLNGFCWNQIVKQCSEWWMTLSDNYRLYELTAKYVGPAWIPLKTLNVYVCQKLFQVFVFALGPIIKFGCLSIWRMHLMSCLLIQNEPLHCFIQNTWNRDRLKRKIPHSP